MNHTALHVGLNGELIPLPWDVDFPGRGIVLLRAHHGNEALAYTRAYELMLLIIDLRGVAEADGVGFDAACEVIAQLHAVPREGLPALLVGLTDAPLSVAERARLADVGLSDLLHHDDPAAFLVSRLEQMLLLRELQQFQRTRMDVGILAQKTRESLHDLSQPLSALQGRLQLMAVKLPADDPQAKVMQELVRLIFEVSQHVIEIQQLHRTVS